MPIACTLRTPQRGANRARFTLLMNAQKSEFFLTDITIHFVVFVVTHHGVVKFSAKQKTSINSNGHEQGFKFHIKFARWRMKLCPRNILNPFHIGFQVCIND